MDIFEWTHAAVTDGHMIVAVRVAGREEPRLQSRLRGNRDAAVSGSKGFSLTELLVAMGIILVLASLAGAAVSAASSSQKKFRTTSLLASLDAIINSQFEEYASRSVGTTSGQARGEALRARARGDLPDNWEIVAELAALPPADLTLHQRAYVAVWNSIANKQQVALANSSAECLFMIVMQGGVADCLSCRGLRIEIGDQDGDNMPEFLDAWGSPIGFVLWPSGLRLPPESSVPFFSPVLPFDPALPGTDDAKGGLMRPLLVSAGPDRQFGLGTNASPIPGTNDHFDNLTNLDEEARR